MPITTRTVAKGIPPRLHEPKPTAKSGTSKPKKSGKRVASESESESESEEELVKKKTKRKKRQRVSHDPSVSKPRKSNGRGSRGSRSVRIRQAS
jgi:hypothetical protein